MLSNKLEYLAARCRIAALRAVGHNIRAARHVRLRHGSKLTARKGSITLGDRTTVHSGAIIDASGGEVTIGARVSINPYTILYGHGGLEVGDCTRIAAHVVIIASDHVFDDPTTPVTDQGLRRRGIKIGRDVWIGAGAKILDGAEIGDGCIVGANAVFKGRSEPNGVYVGVPARRVKDRGQPRPEASPT